MAPVNHGGATSLVTAGASPLRNFECGGDRPPSPREVGAYAFISYYATCSVSFRSCYRDGKLCSI